MAMYKYIISYFCEESMDEKCETGFVTAESFADAAMEVTNYYGERDTINVNLFWISDREILIMPNKPVFSLEDIKNANDF